MHIQSGACAPLPLVYNQLASKIKFSPKETPGLRTRTWIDSIGSIVLGDGGKLQKLDSIKIGDRSVQDNSKTYLKLKNSYDFCKEEAIDKSVAPSDATYVYTESMKEKGESIRLSSGKSYTIVIEEPDDLVFSPMIVMPMDMEYAHIAGYDGQTIYHEEKGEVFYYHRKTGLFAEELGEKIDLSHEIEKKKEVLKLKKWPIQFEDHKKSAAKHPLQLIPLYHYEPRRWRLSKSEKTDEESFSTGSWNYPFLDIATEKNSGLFAGFKMYTPLGYRPLDDKLPHMAKYYEKCEKEKIPILNHCSPGGMLTHEQPFYKDYIEKGIQYPEEGDPKNRDYSMELLEKSLSPTRHKDYLHEANEWFSNNYVHPRAWRPVLDKFPDLFLCLAHFGGDDWEFGPSKSDWIQEIINLTGEYANCYTDISCFAIQKNMPEFIKAMRQHPHLKDKVLFGTDWYMTLIVSASGQKQYSDFCKMMKENLDEIDDSIWIRTSFLNPVKFYGFDNTLKLEKIKDSLKLSGANSDKLNKNLSILKKAIKEIETIKNSL